MTTENLGWFIAGILTANALAIAIAWAGYFIRRKKRQRRARPLQYANRDQITAQQRIRAMGGK